MTNDTGPRRSFFRPGLTSFTVEKKTNGRREVDTVTAEAELNRFLDRQAGKVAEDRAGQEHANALEQMWRDSERRHAEQHREYNRNLWICYFRTLARNHAGISENYERRAQALQEGDTAA